MKSNPNPRAGIIQAQATAAALANAVRQQGLLGRETGEVIAASWETVATALAESATPDKSVPGSQAEWAHRKPLIQAMVDAIRAAEAALVGGSGNSRDVLEKLKAQLAELQGKLQAGQEPAPVEIDFGQQTFPGYITGAKERKEFADRTAYLVARAQKAGR